MLRLGEMYFHGYYVEKDFAKAKEYYEGLLCNEVYKDSGSMYVTLAKNQIGMEVLLQKK